MYSKKVGTSALNTSRYSSGVGYLVIPSDVGRGEYIKECFATGYIMIQGEENNAISGVRCSKQLIQDLEFPNKVGELGTQILYITLPKYKDLVAIASLDNLTDYNQIQPNSFKLVRNSDKGYALIEGSGDGNMIISLNSSDSSKGQLNISVGNDENSGLFKLDIRGSAAITSSQDFNLESESSINATVGDSLLKMIDGQVDIISKSINHNEGKEPMVLGDVLGDFLSDFVSEVGKSTVATAIGTQPLLNAVQINALKAKIEAIKSKISKLD